MQPFHTITASILATATVTPSPDATPVRLDVTDSDGRIHADVAGHCGPCGGCGWVFESDEHGRRWTSPCPACGPVRAQAEALTAAGLPGGPFMRATLDATRWGAYGLPWLERSARGYCDRFVPGSESLCFWGPNQRGKTHLTVAMARGIALRGYVVRWVRMPQLLEMERVECTARRGFLRSGRVDLLVLDELGGADSGRMDWMRGVYEETLGARLEAGLSCLVSTNLRPSAAAGEPLALVDCVGERVAARLRRYARSVELAGPEYLG